MGKKLYRSSRQRIFAGVCGGLAEYFNVDVSIIRLLWTLAAFWWGSGLLLYIIAAIIMPKEEDMGGTTVTDENGNVIYVDNEKNSNINNNAMLFVGAVLVVIGGLIVSNQFFPLRELARTAFRIFRGYIFPLLLVACGIVIIVSTLRRNN